MKTPKKNPGELPCEERLKDALAERDKASAACMALIAEAETLIGKIEGFRTAAAHDEAEEARKRIAKIRKGK